MRKEYLFEELSSIDTDLILEAAPCENKKGTSRKGRIIMRYAAICASLALMIVAAGIFVHFQNKNITPVDYAPVAKICFDVNPGIEVEIDGNNIVVHVKAVNSDGENVIGGIDFKGKSIEEASLELVESMLEKGYINKETNYLLLTIESERDMQELEDKLMSKIAVSIKEVNGKIIVQQIDKDAENSEIADMYGITVGKAKLIKGIAEKYTEKTLEELSKMTVTELSGFVYKKEEKTELVFDYPYEIKAPEGCMAASEAFDVAMRSLEHSAEEIRDLMIRKAGINGEDYEFDIYYRVLSYNWHVTFSVNGKTGNVTVLNKECSRSPYPGFVISHPDAHDIAVDGVKDIFLTIELTTTDTDTNGVPHYIVRIMGKNYDNENIEYVVFVDAVTGDILEMKKK